MMYAFYDTVSGRRFNGGTARRGIFPFPDRYRKACKAAQNTVYLDTECFLIMARKNFGAKPYTYPQPVLIVAAYGENDVPSAMNAAWGGISDYKEISMDLSKGHKTVKDLRARGAFTVSMGTRAQMVACDYVGLVSGNKVPDKVAKAGWHTVKSEFVDAPLIQELPLALECRVLSYDEETGVLKGEIVNVSADTSILDKDGNVDVKKLEPITFDPFNNKYIALGDVIGDAFQSGLALK